MGTQAVTVAGTTNDTNNTNNTDNTDTTDTTNTTNTTRYPWKKVIAFSMYYRRTANHAHDLEDWTLYRTGLLQNLVLAKTIFPGWIPRVYIPGQS